MDPLCSPRNRPPRRLSRPRTAVFFLRRAATTPSRCAATMRRAVFAARNRLQPRPFAQPEAGEGRHGQRSGGRRPVGRRRQGQAGGLAVGARRRHRPLPGRPQRRPYAGHRRGDLQAVAAALGHRAQGQAERDRQRRGARPLGAAGRDRQAARPGGGDLHRQPADRGEHAADPAGAWRAGPRPRIPECGGQDRHHRARHRPVLRGQGRAPGDPGGRPRRPGDAGASARPAADPSRRAAPRAGPARDRPGRTDRRADGGGPQGAALRRPGLEGPGGAEEGRRPHPVRGGAGRAARHPM